MLGRPETEHLQLHVGGLGGSEALRQARTELERGIIIVEKKYYGLRHCNPFGTGWTVSKKPQYPGGYKL